MSKAVAIAASDSARRRVQVVMIGMLMTLARRAEPVGLGAAGVVARQRAASRNGASTVAEWTSATAGAPCATAGRCTTAWTGCTTAWAAA